MTPFLLTITYDPQKPGVAKLDIVPAGDNAPRLDDVIDAVRIAYERFIMEKGIQLALANSSPDRELNHETAV